MEKYFEVKLIYIYIYILKYYKLQIDQIKHFKKKIFALKSNRKIPFLYPLSQKKKKNHFKLLRMEKFSLPT